MALYAGIVEVVAPDGAVPGSRVDITVRVKNLYSAPVSVMAHGALECGVTPWPVVEFPQRIATIGAGATVAYDGYFIMPDRPATIHVYTYWYGSDGLWYYDDEGTKAVAVMELRYEFDIGTPAVSAA